MNFIIELGKLALGLLKIFLGIVLFMAALCVGQLPD